MKNLLSAIALLAILLTQLPSMAKADSNVINSGTINNAGIINNGTINIQFNDIQSSSWAYTERNEGS